MSLRIHLDLPPANHPHAARLADPRFVVSVHIRTHGQFGLVLLRVQQFEDLFGVLNRILAAFDRAGNRTGLNPPASHPDIHFRRGPDQIFIAAEIDEK